MGQENRGHQDDLILNSCICLVWLYYLKIGIDLVIIAVLIVALECLQPCVDTIKHYLFFDQLFDHQFDGLFAQEREERNLEIFNNFF